MQFYYKITLEAQARFIRDERKGLIKRAPAKREVRFVGKE
jgi:hypothetical protein